MSYTLQIFQPPPAVRPLRPDDVLSLMEGMYDQAPPPGTTTYRDLVRLVKASVSPAQRGEWLEALTADDTSAVFNMAVETGRAEQLVALVVRCARSMRLAVLDQQAAIAYWPDGTEIRFPPPEPVPGLPDAVKVSELGPIQLPPGQAYMLYCGYFALNERALAEKLPELLSANIRPSQSKPQDWLLALEERLTRAFGRQATAESIWSQDLPAAADLFRVMPLAVKSERILEARPRILEIVHSVDKEVFDPQAMQVHGPDGHICWRSAHWQAPGTERGRPDPDLLPLEVAKLVAPQLGRYGFVEDRKAGYLVRRFPHVTQTVLIYGSHWDVNVNVWLEVTQPTDLPQQVVPSGRPETKDTAGIWGHLADFVGDQDFDEPLFFDRQANRSVIFRHSKMEPVAREIARVLVERVVPYYDARTSVQAIHAAINGPRAEEHPLWPVLPSTRLTIAYMAGEPRLAEMAARELEKLRAWKYDPKVRGLNRTEWEREVPKVEALVEWLGGRG